MKIASIFLTRIRDMLQVQCSTFVIKGNFSSNTLKENKLLNMLKSKIEATGPISVAEYMKTVLIAPQTGYYMSKDVLGCKGDFVTSPEVSQVFGELIGVWLYNEWSKIGFPKPVQLVEFGPGRGTLTDDILRVFSKFTRSEVELPVHFIEVSPHLCQIQMTKLCNDVIDGDLHGKTLLTKHGFPITWHAHLASVPEAFTLYLAHEFLDALPIHKFQKTDSGWKEVLIDFKDGELCYILSRTATPASKLLIRTDDTREHAEVSPETGILLNDVTRRMEEDGGIALIVDYGHSGTKTDTFRSFKDHKLHDPLKSVGEADLTADVDFDFILRHTEGKAIAVGPVTQATFLRNMGIDVRLQKLTQNASPEERESLTTGYDMLTHPDKMGERFKFLALYPLVLKDVLSKYPPAGF